MPRAKQDWFEIGLNRLVSSGTAGLTIDGMCRDLGVTKGSFYHHFKNLQDFKDQLLTYWREVDTQQVVETASSINEGEFDLDGLIQILGSRSSETANPELAIRAWAMQDQTVHAFVEQIDILRIRMTHEMLKEVTGDDERAHLLARMLYAMLVGSYSIIPPIEKKSVIKLYEEFKQLFVTIKGL